MTDRIITLKYAGKCCDCSASLPAGTRAKYYGNNIVSCEGCKSDPGVYTLDGRKIGSTCGCEDFPCCGH